MIFSHAAIVKRFTRKYGMSACLLLMMRRRIALFGLVFTLAIFLPASAQIAPPQHTWGVPDDLNQFIPAQMQKWKVPGLAIAVVQNGQVTYSHGFGLRDVKANLPVTSKTIFAIGYISKSFT